MAFPNATELRNQLLPNLTTQTEINAIELAIITATDSGTAYNVSVGGADVSIMTDTSAEGLAVAESYYTTWNAGANATDPSKLAEINSVIDYFTKLSYTIKVAVNTSTSTTLLWKVSW